MKKTTRTTLLAAGLAVLAQGAFAQSNCKEAKGNIAEVFGGGDSSTGPLSQGGWLNGTILFVFNTGTFPTPDPNKVTFGAAFTLTTNQGQLKGKTTFLFDFVTGQGPSMLNIDPAASTGVFAGATGLLFVNTIKGTLGPPPNYYYDLVGGQVCFAR